MSITPPRHTNYDEFEPFSSVEIGTTSESGVLRAYTEFVTEHGHKPSVRALCEQARCGADTAAAWLREKAPGVTVKPPAPPAPTEALAPALEPLWAVAYDEARTLIATQHQSELEAAYSSERAALAEAERLREQLDAKATEAEHHVNYLRHKLKHERRETEVRLIEAEDVIDQLQVELMHERRETESRVAKAYS